MVTNNEKLALFDLDGMLADFVAGMQAAMKPLEGPGESWDYDTYDQDNEPAFMRARRRLAKNKPGFWRELPPYRPGFALLEIAVRVGFRVVVFTKAPRKQPAAFAEKAEWCKQHLDPVLGPDGYDIAMVTDKGNTYGRILVDDWPPYIDRWLEHRPRGRVFMPDHGYNRNYPSGHARTPLQISGKKSQVIRYHNQSKAENQMMEELMREAFER